MNHYLMILVFFIVICNCSTKNIINDLGDQLYQETRKGDYQKVQELIKNGANVNYKKRFLSHDEYPLNGAIKGGNIEIVKLLVDYGAKIDTENEDRGSLDDAVYKENKKIIQYLLSKGIYIDKSCSSSLMFSALYTVSLEMLKYVVENLGVCVDSKEILYGDTPLYKTISNERLQETSYLLKKGASVNIQNKEKQTPLHRAVFVGNIRIIELLLKNGADITIKDEKGMTPLDYAEQAKNAQLVRLLKRYKR